MSEHNPILKSCILCDDVRREESGKYILSGVYTGGPIVREVPQLAEMHVFCIVEYGGLDGLDMRFLVEAENFAREGHVRFEEGETVGNIELGFPFWTLLEEGGKIRFHWTTDKGQGGTFEWKVTVADNATRISPEDAAIVRTAFEASLALSKIQ